MPFMHGRATHVYFGGADLSPYLNAADVSVDTDRADVTAFGTTWRASITGDASAKASLAGYYDPTAIDLESAITGTGNDLLTVCNGGGTAIGDPARLLIVNSSSVATSAPVGGVVAIKWDAEANGAVGFGWVLHPYGADVNTTTGADRDDLAATATGWMAHLHVSGITGAGTWVVKLQDAATTDWADVTGAAFAAASVEGAQRLVSAAATTALRRHVRYMATRTGGSAGDSLSFQLSYSRNT